MAIKIGMLSFSPLHIGGAESHILSLLRYLNKQDFQVYVLGTMSKAFREKVTSLGGEAIPIVARSKGDWRAARDLYQVIREFNLDILHSQDTRGGLIGRIVAKMAGKRTVHTVHMTSYYQLLDAPPKIKLLIYEQAERLLNLYLSDAVIYVSETVLKEQIQKGLAHRRNSIVIRNGIELSRFTIGPDTRRKIRQALEVSEETLVICSIGRLTPQKGLIYLIQAAPSIITSVKRINFWIVGDGPLRDSLKGKVKQLGLENYFRFLGFRNDIPDILAGADIFVLPSLYECLPIAVIEAMASGKPVVATRVGGNEELVKDGETGFLVPPRNADALAKKLVMLLSDEELRCRVGHNALREAQKYDAKEMVFRYEQVYRALCNTPRTKSV